MQAQAQAPRLNISNLAALQQPAEGFEPEELKSKEFDTSKNSLTGNAEQDQLLLGIITTLVQLLMRHFDGEQQQNNGGNNHNSDDNENGGQQSATNNSAGANGNSSGADLSDQFSNRDKNLLLNAIGTNPASGTGINSINDTNASGHLNGGDNLQLQASNSTQTHAITGEEVSKFIDARNPPNTPKLPLNPQQSSALENRFGLENISISDTSGDQTIGLNDILSGTQNQGGANVRVDIPLNQDALSLIGTNSNNGGGNGLLSTGNTGINSGPQSATATNTSSLNITGAAGNNSGSVNNATGQTPTNNATQNSSGNAFEQNSVTTLGGQDGAPGNTTTQGNGNSRVIQLSGLNFLT